MKVYLDNAATTPVAPEVFEAMVPILKNNFGNPSSIHLFGRSSKAIIEHSRREKSLNIFFVNPLKLFLPREEQRRITWPCSHLLLSLE